MHTGSLELHPRTHRRYTNTSTHLGEQIQLSTSTTSTNEEKMLQARKSADEIIAQRRSGSERETTMKYLKRVTPDTASDEVDSKVVLRPIETNSQDTYTCNVPRKIGSGSTRGKKAKAARPTMTVAATSHGRSMTRKLSMNWQLELRNAILNYVNHAIHPRRTHLRRKSAAR